MKIKIVGVGGVGGWLIDFVAMVTAARDKAVFPDTPQITLVDGDVYEEKNRLRQRFGRIGNKAEITAERLKEEYASRIHVFAEPVFVTADNVGALIREKDILLCCADSHKVRKLLSDRCCELNDVLMLAGGNNDEYDCSVQLHLRVGGNDLTLPAANEYHPEVLDPKDENPAERMPDCNEQAAAGNVQLPGANIKVASMMLDGFLAFLGWRSAKEGRKHLWDESVSNVVAGVTTVMYRTNPLEPIRFD